MFVYDIDIRWFFKETCPTCRLDHLTEIYVVPYAYNMNDSAQNKIEYYLVSKNYWVHIDINA